MSTQYKPFTDYGQHQPQHKSRSGWPVWATVVLSAFGGIVLVCGLLTVFAFAVSDVDPEAQVTGGPEIVAEPEPVDTAEATAALDIEVVETYTEENAVGDAYTAVRVEAYNVSDRSVYVGPLDWHVVDADGFKHEAEYGPFSTREDRLPGLDLEQDEATTGVFHVEGVVDVATVVYQRWNHDEPIEVNVQ